MFEKYTYKQKFIALIVVFFMLGYNAYKYSFSRLVDTYQVYSELYKDYNDFDNRSKTYTLMESQSKMYDRIIGRVDLPKEVVQQRLVGFSSKFPSIKINYLDPVHTYKDSLFVVNTNQLDLVGGLNDLLEINYKFETAFKHSNIASMSFYKSKKASNKETLHLKIYFQNYENR